MRIIRSIWIVFVAGFLALSLVMIYGIGATVAGIGEIIVRIGTMIKNIANRIADFGLERE